MVKVRNIVWNLATTDNKFIDKFSNKVLIQVYMQVETKIIASDQIIGPILAQLGKHN